MVFRLLKIDKIINIIYIFDSLMIKKNLKRWMTIVRHLINLVRWLFQIVFWLFSNIWWILFWSLWVILTILAVVAIFILAAWFFFMIMSILYSIQFIPIFSIKAKISDYWIRKYEYSSSTNARWQIFNWEYDKTTKQILKLASFVSWWLIPEKSEISLKERIEKCRLATYWDANTDNWTLNWDSRDLELYNKIKNEKQYTSKFWYEIVDQAWACYDRVREIITDETDGTIVNFINWVDNEKSIQQSSQNTYSVFQLQWLWLSYIKDYSNFCYNVWTIKNKLTTEDLIDWQKIEKLNTFFNTKYLFWQRVLNPHWKWQVESLDQEEKDFWTMLYSTSNIANILINDKSFNQIKDKNVFIKFIVDLINERTFADKDLWWNHRKSAYWIFVNSLWDSQYFTNLVLNFDELKHKYSIPINSFETNQALPSRKALLNFYKQHCEWTKQVDFIKNNLYASNSFLLTKPWQDWFTKKIFLDSKNRFNELKPYESHKLIWFISLEESVWAENFSTWNNWEDIAYRNLLKNYIYFNNITLNDNKEVLNTFWKNIWQSHTKLTNLYNQLKIVWWVEMTKSLINKLNDIVILKWYLSWRYSVLDLWITKNIYKSDQYYKYITLMNPFPSYNTKITIKDSDITYWWIFEMIHWSIINWEKKEIIKNIPYIDVNITDFAKSKWYQWNKEIIVKYYLYWIWKDKEKTLFWKWILWSDTKLWEINPYTFKNHWFNWWTDTTLLLWSLYEQTKKDIEDYLTKLDTVLAQWYDTNNIKDKNYVWTPKKVEICRKAPIEVENPYTVINKNYYQLLDNNDFNWWFTLTLPSKKYYQVCVEIDNVLVNWWVYSKVYWWDQNFSKKFFEIWRTNVAYVNIKLKDYIPETLDDWNNENIYYNNTLWLLEKYKTKSLLFNDWKFCTINAQPSISTSIANTAWFWSPFWNLWNNTIWFSIPWVHVKSYNTEHFWIKNTDFNFTIKNWDILNRQSELYQTWNKKRTKYFNEMNVLYWRKNWKFMSYIQNQWRNDHFENLYVDKDKQTYLNWLSVSCNFVWEWDEKKSFSIPIDRWVSDYLLDKNTNALAINSESQVWIKSTETIKKLVWYDIEKWSDLNELDERTLYNWLNNNVLNNQQKTLKYISVYNALLTIWKNKYDDYFEYIKTLLWDWDWLDVIWNILFKEWNKDIIQNQEYNTIMLDEESSITKENILSYVFTEASSFFKSLESKFANDYNEFFKSFRFSLLKNYYYFFFWTRTEIQNSENFITKKDILWDFYSKWEINENNVKKLINLYQEIKSKVLWWDEENLELQKKLQEILPSYTTLWKIWTQLDWSLISPYTKYNDWYLYSSLHDIWLKAPDWKELTSDQLLNWMNWIELSEKTDPFSKVFWLWINFYTIDNYQKFWWSKTEKILKRMKTLEAIQENIKEFFNKECSEEDLRLYLLDLNWIDWRKWYQFWWFEDKDKCTHKAISNMALSLQYLSNLSLREEARNVWAIPFVISKNKLNQLWYSILQDQIKWEYLKKYNEILYFDFENYKNEFREWKINENYQTLEERISTNIEKQSKEKFEKAKKNYEKMIEWNIQSFDSQISSIDKALKKLEDSKLWKWNPVVNKPSWTQQSWTQLTLNWNSTWAWSLAQLNPNQWLPQVQSLQQQNTENSIANKVKEIKEKVKEWVNNEIDKQKQKLENEKQQLEEEKKKIQNQNTSFTTNTLSQSSFWESTTNEFIINPTIKKYKKPKLEEELEFLWYYTYLNPIVSFFKKPPKEFSKEDKNYNLSSIEKKYKDLWKLEQIFHSYIIYSNLWNIETKKDEKWNTIQDTSKLPLFQYKQDEIILKWLQNYFWKEWFLKSYINENFQLKYSSSKANDSQNFVIETDLTKIWQWYYHALYEMLKLKVFDNEKTICTKPNESWSEIRWLLAILQNKENQEVYKELCEETHPLLTNTWLISTLYWNYLHNLKNTFDFETRKQLITSLMVQKFFNKQEWSYTNLNTKELIHDKLVDWYLNTYKTQNQIVDEIINDSRKQTWNAWLKMLWNIIYLWQHSISYIYHYYFAWLLSSWNEEIINKWIQLILEWNEQKFKRNLQDWHMKTIIQDSIENIKYEKFNVQKDLWIKNTLFWIDDFWESVKFDKDTLINNHLKNIERNVMNTMIYIYWLFTTNQRKWLHTNMSNKINDYFSSSYDIWKMLDEYLTDQEKKILSSNKWLFNLQIPKKEEENKRINSYTNQLLVKYQDLHVFWMWDKDWNVNIKKLWSSYYQYLVLLKNLLKYHYFTLEQWGKNNELITELLQEMWITYLEDKQKIWYLLYYLEWIISIYNTNWSFQRLVLEQISNTLLLKDYTKLFDNENSIYWMILYMYWYDRFHDNTWSLTDRKIVQNKEWEYKLEYDLEKYVMKHKAQAWATLNLNLLSNEPFSTFYEKYWADWLLKNNLSTIALSIVSQIKNNDQWMYFASLFNEAYDETKTLEYEHVFNVTATWKSEYDKQWKKVVNEAKTYILWRYFNNVKLQSLVLQNSIQRDMNIFWEYLSTNKFLNTLLTNKDYEMIRNKVNINDASIDTIVKSYLVSEQLNVKNFWLLNELLSTEKYKKHSIELHWVQNLNEDNKLNIIAFNYFSYELNKNRFQEIENAANALKNWWINPDIAWTEWEWFVKWLKYINCKSLSRCEQIITDVSKLNNFWEFSAYIWKLREEAKQIKDEDLQKLTLHIINKLVWISEEYFSWLQQFYFFEQYSEVCSSYEDCYKIWWWSWQCVWWSNVFIMAMTWINCRYYWHAYQQDDSLVWKWSKPLCRWSWTYMWLPWWNWNYIYFKPTEWWKWNLIWWHDSWWWWYWHIFYIAAYDAETDRYLIMETNWWNWQVSLWNHNRFKVSKFWSNPWRTYRNWKPVYIQWMFDLDQPFSNNSQ